MAVFEKNAVDFMVGRSSLPAARTTAGGQNVPASTSESTPNVENCTSGMSHFLWPRESEQEFWRERVPLRGIHAKTVAIARTRNLLPRADRDRVPKQTAQPGRIERNEVAVFRIAFASGLRPCAESRHGAEGSGARKSRCRLEHG